MLKNWFLYSNFLFCYTHSNIQKKIQISIGKKAVPFFYPDFKNFDFFSQVMILLKLFYLPDGYLFFTNWGLTERGFVLQEEILGSVNKIKRK